MTEVADRKGLVDDLVAAPKPRRWPWVIGALVVVALIAIVLMIFASDSDEAVDSEAEPVNTAEAVLTDLIDETVYDGTLGTTEDDAIVAPVAGVISYTPRAGDTVSFGEAAFAIDGEPVVLLAGDRAAFRDFRLGEDRLPVRSRTVGTLTEAVEAGTIVEQGDVIARIDGEPVVVLYGDVPMFRTLQDLSDNITGADVLQLEQALTDLGYNDGDVTVDDEFTQSTEEMVERWQEALGVDENGIVTVSDVVFIPGPAQVSATGAQVGDLVTDGSPLFDLTSGPLLEGQDVLRLERALAELGFDADGSLVVDGVFDLPTVDAIKQLEVSLGATVDGMLRAGEVRFSESGVRVTEINADVGTTVNPGAPVVLLSSPDKIVTFDLPAADQDLVAVGDAVVIELPDGEEVPGTVSFVAETATTSVDQQSAVFEVEIVLDDPSVAADLEQAPVDVSVVSDSVSSVVAVPVSALVALAEGGYAVEVMNPDGTTNLVRVEPGFYAEGLVEIESDAVEPGTTVVVP